MCTHCHGDKGEGNGKVVKASGDLIVPPAYVTLKDRTLGSIFHTITHGKNEMGPNGAQMYIEESWKVALYVRSLQNGGDLLLSELTAPKSSNEVTQMKDN